MGYYIEVPNNKGKAQQLVELHGARILGKKPSFNDYPQEAVICVLDNGTFEAAGYAFSERELEVFAFPDMRPKTWLVMDRKKAHKLTGFKECAS